ncbi:Uma2 family endonuclease [Actinomadura sp. NEAU-AAG7]|uniref:Uma2 family endonuclease n=1 Tax=Actinomadura sp. NEAU-AAG7 TaxID=2839640 RepID=UPI001BE44A0D|nr:Uma2 family endonuclease [Actinomadura sp. NEAU-AAG7]MBT2208430.1 Uma2 family endonuclease [Actinomadura sp. NEAU-AAG7]
MSLPDTAYNMWTRGELDDFVHAPEGHRVEVIEGRVVVSPPPAFEHNAIIGDISYAMAHAHGARAGFPWRTDQGTGLSLVGIGAGFVPDLVVLDEAVYLAARRSRVRTLVPDQVELVVEVTSPGNAGNDRRPGERGRNNKWNGYATAEVPYYLLIDRSPKIARSVLFSIPDQGSAAYLHEDSWDFGETIRLPEPFDVDIDTAEWKPWSD